MEQSIAVQAQMVEESQRMNIGPKMFGAGRFCFQVEIFIYSFADRLSADYAGGYWDFYTLSNGGFFMAPRSAKPFVVTSPNGYTQTLSPEAFGIVACLYAYSALMGKNDAFREKYLAFYEMLLDYAEVHPEHAEIYTAID